MKFISRATQIGQAFKNVGRLREVLAVLVSHGFADLIHRVKLSRFLPRRYSSREKLQQLPIPQRLRMSFEDLGPTFVKLGQLVSTRSDLLPEDVVEEFQKLQDNVSATDSKEIIRFLERELKAPIQDIFQSFDASPVAAASIAQVHLAVLKTGEKVAVKIQRPGIERIIHNDISILRGLAQLLERYVWESRPFNPVGMIDEFFKTMLEELDFRVEANNIRRIKANLAGFEKVAVPEVYVKYSTSRILVLERFEGVRFSDRETIIQKGINPSEIVELGSDVFFHMVMRDGIFHGDLHPGNLFILSDGRIGIIDFGIVGRLSRRIQDSILVMFTSLVEEDYETLAYEYVNISHSSMNTDVGMLQKDLMDAISPYVGMSLGEINVGKILLRSTAIAVRHRLQVPRELMLLFKAMVTIESMGKRLDPHFDMMKVGNRLARQLLTARYSKERVFRDILVIGRDVQTMAETLPRLLRRFFRVWSQRQYAFEVRNPDIMLLSFTIQRFSTVLTGLVISFFLWATGLTIFVMDKGPRLFGLPIYALAFGLSGLIGASFTFWKVRKRFTL